VRLHKSITEKGLFFPTLRKPWQTQNAIEMGGDSFYTRISGSNFFKIASTNKVRRHKMSFGPPVGPPPFGPQPFGPPGAGPFDAGRDDYYRQLDEDRFVADMDRRRQEEEQSREDHAEPIQAPIIQQDELDDDEQTATEEEASPLEQFNFWKESAEFWNASVRSALDEGDHEAASEALINSDNAIAQMKEELDRLRGSADTAEDTSYESYDEDE
jgi:hypothetical protein